MNNALSPVLNVMRRELAGYFSTPVAWVFIVIFLVMAGAFTFYIGSFYDRALDQVDKYLVRNPDGDANQWGEIDKAQYDLMRRDLETGETKK